MSIFKAWLRGASADQLRRYCGASATTIRRVIRHFLDRPPKSQPIPNPRCHLVIDATWFGKERCLLVYWDKDLQHIQWWRYTRGERTEEIAEDLNRLKTAGVVCVSVTSDGGSGIRRAVEWCSTSIPHQRCVVHVQRFGSILLTRRPKTLAGRDLKLLLKLLLAVRKAQERDDWLLAFQTWDERWSEFLKERSSSPETGRTWFTHRSLRKIRTLVRNAIPDLFLYVEDPSIPKDTNGLEGRFSGLKFHYRQHRGLSLERRNAYLAWYITAVINRNSPTPFGH